MLSGIFCLAAVRNQNFRQRHRLMVMLSNGSERQLLNSSVDDVDEEDEIP